MLQLSSVMIKKNPISSNQVFLFCTVSLYPHVYRFLYSSSFLTNLRLFSFPWCASFRNNFNEVLFLVNSLSFCLSKNVGDIYVTWKLLLLDGGWKLFSFYTLKAFFHCLLASIVAVEKDSCQSNWHSLGGSDFLFWLLLWSSSCVCWPQCVYVRIFLFLFPALEVCCDSRIWREASFINSGKFQPLFLQLFLSILFSLSRISFSLLLDLVIYPSSLLICLSYFLTVYLSVLHSG